MVRSGLDFAPHHAVQIERPAATPAIEPPIATTSVPRRAGGLLCCNCTLVVAGAGAAAFCASATRGSNAALPVATAVATVPPPDTL
jgi:hypothetical protein